MTRLISFVFIFFVLVSRLFAVSPIQPATLKKGDLIAVVAPASCPEEDKETIARAVKILKQRGYRVKLSSNLLTRYGYLAGTDDHRAKALMDAWRDPEVKMIWCYRGGFGCTRILDKLDYQMIRDNPKIFIGMSDVTALHAAIIKETGLITFLGPNLNAVFGKTEKNDSLYNERQIWKMIADENVKSFPDTPLSNPKSFPISGETVYTLRGGVGRGRLVGGTLSLVTSLIGTAWEIHTKGNILILEEVDEEPYRIDRMLSQLKLAGHLDDLGGLVLCSWKGCKEKRPDKSLSLEHVFKEYFEKANYPVLLGFPSGHIIDQATLPLNALAELDATKKTLRLLEHPVQVKLPKIEP